MLLVQKKSISGKPTKIEKNFLTNILYGPVEQKFFKFKRIYEFCQLQLAHHYSKYTITI